MVAVQVENPSPAVLKPAPFVFSTQEVFNQYEDFLGAEEARKLSHKQQRKYKLNERMEDEVDDVSGKLSSDSISGFSLLQCVNDFEVENVRTFWPTASPMAFSDNDPIASLNQTRPS